MSNVYCLKGPLAFGPAKLSSRLLVLVAWIVVLSCNL